MAALAGWMGLGTLHDFGHADSLLPVLISTQRWTPFYWGQDRFGMLVPLLAMPLRHPLANLLAQGWMMTTAALVAPFAVARFLGGRRGQWIAIGAGTNLLFLLSTPPAVQFDWFVAQPYGPSLALGFLGLIAAAEGVRIRDSVAGAVLIALACWINIGIVVLLAIASVLQRARPVRLLALNAAGTALALALARYGAATHTISDLSPPRQWFTAWRLLLMNSFEAITNSTLVWVVVATAAAIAVWLWRTERARSWTPLLVAITMAAGMWLVTGTSLWVGMNLYVFRYMYPSLMLVGLAISSLLVAPFATRANAASALVIVALSATTVARYGMPSLGRVERSIDERFGGLTASVLHSGATVIAGDYWRVWPAVFHANLELARTHRPGRIFGLAFRSEATDVLWKIPGRPVLIAGATGDPSVTAVAEEHGVAATLHERQTMIDLYAGRP